MIIVHRARRCGKTTLLAQWVMRGEERAAYPGWTRILLVADIQEADRIRKEHNLEYRQVFTWDEWQRVSRGFEDIEVCIDNAEWILERIAGVHNHLMVSSMTATNDEEGLYA